MSATAGAWRRRTLAPPLRDRCYRLAFRIAAEPSFHSFGTTARCSSDERAARRLEILRAQEVDSGLEKETVDLRTRWHVVHTSDPAGRGALGALQRFQPRSTAGWQRGSAPPADRLPVVETDQTHDGARVHHHRSAHQLQLDAHETKGLALQLRERGMPADQNHLDRPRSLHAVIDPTQDLRVTSEHGTQRVVRRARFLLDLDV